MNSQSGFVFSDLHRTVRDFHDPEKAVWQSPRTEIMKLGPQTEVPEVNSYLHKSAVRMCRSCCAGAVGVCDLPANIFPLIHAKVGYDDIRLALIVRRRAACVPHGRDTAKIR